MLQVSFQFARVCRKLILNLRGTILDIAKGLIVGHNPALVNVSLCNRRKFLQHINNMKNSNQRAQDQESTQHGAVKEQLMHIVVGACLFAVIAGAGILLDLFSTWVKSLGVSEFTAIVISTVAHSLLIVDTLLFCLYVLVTSWSLVRLFWEMLVHSNTVKEK